jgi:hypothetical protein
VEQLIRNSLRSVEHFDKQDWMLVMVAVLVLGAFCLRGFGSRSNY